MLSVYVLIYPHFDILNQLADVHEIYYERCAVGGGCRFHSLAFSHNCMVDARVGEVAAAQSAFDGWFRRVVI